jgi:nucleotide-binding universal stress UspA family protein
MFGYSKLAVCGSLRERDLSLFRYAAYWSQLAGAEEVGFVHVAESLDIPPAIQELYPDLVTPIDEFAETRLGEEVSSAFSELPETATHCKIAEGNVLEEILHFVSQEESDLLVVGKSSDQEHEALLAARLSRKAPCSVLTVPQDSRPKIERILTSVDFSTHSDAAVEQACAIAKAAGVPEVECLNVYHVPTGYGKLGLTFDQFADAMRENADRDFQRMMADVDAQGIRLVPRFELNLDAPQAIAEVCRAREIDLLVVGARGRSAGAAVLLGSVTEQLIRETRVPLLAVKPKGTGMGVLQALLNL